jgi:SIR2-like domain
VFRFFADDECNDAIQRLGSAPSLSVFVGAGASSEVGLPTWTELVRRLATKVVQDEPPESHERLLAFIMDAGPLAAAERVERSLTDSALVDEIKIALYQDDSPDAVRPGRLCEAVADLRMAWPEVRIITTNYDQLLVKAIRDRAGAAKSYCGSSEKQEAVFHLHGVVGFEHPEDGLNEIVLTEHQFLAPGSGWRRELVSRALTEGPCLFVGASLTDLSLLTPLHVASGTSGHRHVVLFSRDPQVESGERNKRESIDRARWDALNVQVLFADNYADVAQFVDEVRRRHQTIGGRYVPLPRRAALWQTTRFAKLCPTKTKKYRDVQGDLVASLESLLAAIQSDHDLTVEVMQLGLFGLGVDLATNQDFGTVLATSDRVMRDPRSNGHFAVNRTSQWAGVLAICSGAPVVEPKDHYASRWKFMLAVPVQLGEQYGFCGGAIVLSTTTIDSLLRGVGAPGKVTATKYVQIINALKEAGNLLLG